jgi:catechol 2,3-dioxygenase-like lactoylglutathione lyase family enzyme
MAMFTNARPVMFVLTRDRAITQPFYTDVLGLRQLSEDDFAVAYDLGGGATMRLTTVHDHQPSPHTVMGWEVTDIESAVAALAAKDVKCAIYEGFGQDANGIWTSPDGAARIAWFHDPEGNNLSVAQHE